MENPERPQIEIEVIRKSVNAILNHIEANIGLNSIKIEKDQTMYWTIPSDEMFKLEKDPEAQYIGNLTDDYEFVKNMLEYDNADIRPPVLMLEHVVGLLLALSNKIRG